MLQLRYFLFALLFFGFGVLGYSQAGIDSLSYYPKMVGINGVNSILPLYELFVSDTVQVNSLHIKLGNSVGSADFLDSVLVFSPEVWEQDQNSYAFFYPIRLGVFAANPPEVELTLLNSNSNVGEVRRFHFDE